MNKYEKALIDNLDNLVDAFHLVLNAIEEGDNNTEDCYSELISKGYPFEKSFDELFLNVIDWRDIIKDSIKDKYKNMALSTLKDKNINKAKEIYDNLNNHFKLLTDDCVCIYYILDTTEKYCYALVFNLENSEEFGANILGKVARQPINSLLQCDYDFDWVFPYNDYCGIDDNEISVETWEDVLDLLEHYYKFKEYYFKYE